jgi:anthranilate/para-aminobenzoate synthase component II
MNKLFTKLHMRGEAHTIVSCQNIIISCHTRFLCQNQVLIVCMTEHQLFHTYGQKVSTDNQMSRIKFNYYINNVSKDYDGSQTKRNSERCHNSTGTATGATRSLKLLVEEFQSIFSF